MDNHFVGDVVIGKRRFNQFAKGIGRARPPGGPPAFGEGNAVAFPFRKGIEVGLEFWRTVQRHVEVMSKLKGGQKNSVVFQLTGDVINRLAMDRGEQGQTHHSG